jgi:transposase
MAVSAQRGIVGAQILDHNCRKADFIEFIRHLDVPPDTSLLMDNVAFHHSADTRQMISDKGLRPLFIPPYSPRVNAIENVFGVLKSRYRKRCPVHVNMAVDYKGIMEDLLAEGMDCASFFARVDNFIADTISNGGIGFCGSDV